MPKLVIVESPAKAKTIGKYLGRGYKVTASMGHVRDLPASTLGIDVENGYKPKYITIKGKQKLVKELKPRPKSAMASCLRPTRTARARPSAGIWRTFWGWTPLRPTA